MSSENNPHPKRIRSFVKRPGRMTPGQKRAFPELWPRYGLAADSDIDFAALFPEQTGPRILDIGYGDGDALVALAARHTDARLVGCEVHEPGIGHCMLGLDAGQLTNVRLIAADAVDVLERQIAAGSLDRINLYFPDPWPKKRHHKRRLFGELFLTLCARALDTDGALHVATDWAPYAEHVDEVMATETRFVIGERRQHAGDAPIERITTKFERRGLALGHAIVDWVFVKNRTTD